jgi:hypothetical protein
MAKLRLQLEALTVDTFTTAGESMQRGTVHGASDTTTTPQCEPYTAWYSCVGAGYTCHAGCLPPTTTTSE